MFIGKPGTVGGKTGMEVQVPILPNISLTHIHKIKIKVGVIFY